MKQSIFHFAASLTLALLLTACARNPAVNQPDTDSSFGGTIDKIDLVNQLVTVQHWPLYKTFKAGPSCEITIPGKNTTTTLADLKVGDMVIVDYQGTGKILEASRLARRSREYIREKEEQYERLEEMLNPSPNR